MVSSRFLFLLCLAAGDSVEIDAEGEVLRPEPVAIREDREKIDNEVEREDLQNKKLSFQDSLKQVKIASPQIVSSAIATDMEEKQAYVSHMIELHKEIEALHKIINEDKNHAEDQREDVVEELYAYGRDYDDARYDEAEKRFEEWAESNQKVQNNEKQVALLIKERLETRARITELDIKLKDAFEESEGRAKKVLGLARTAKGKFEVMRTAVESLPDEGFPKAKTGGKNAGQYLGFNGREYGAAAQDAKQQRKSKDRQSRDSKKFSDPSYSPPLGQKSRRGSIVDSPISTNLAPRPGSRK